MSTQPASSQLTQYWQEQIAAWKSSGLKQTEFCRQQQLNAHQFSYWKHKLQRAKDSSPATYGGIGGFFGAYITHNPLAKSNTNKE